MPGLPSTKKIESYRDLLVWQKAMDFAISCYKETQRFPANEQFGLTQQIRRAAVSIPANIAEGFGRWHSRDFLRFLLMANGSLKEVETHLLLSERLGLIQKADREKLEGQCEEIGKMLLGLRKKLTARNNL